ncbi:hypothetical protein QE152_g24840 [Popillia japonica]|uniref:Uncharacterized protein n=1 Tax=Popillia japonica TaxID=7064 RepID=A0AAW1K3C3_POPJA
MRATLLNMDRLSVQDREECRFNVPLLYGKTKDGQLDGRLHVLPTDKPITELRRDGSKESSRKIPQISINLFDGSKDTIIRYRRGILKS